MGLETFKIICRAYFPDCFFDPRLSDPSEFKSSVTEEELVKHLKKLKSQKLPFGKVGLSIRLA